ncbi:reverse transcriptase [Phytophthora megakarya]|uniref:Reverse transcriptase n=1 Tax=Phytophthora megakarya TaxID=4795 RepID=A0A225VQT4_9STRA|nr:reverse transcriptase [Phytophthora megakarya]
MRSFRAAIHEQVAGFYLLQETHVDPKDVDYFSNPHGAGWGFRTGHGASLYSHWAPARDKKAGVAVLINPYGQLQDVTPIYPTRWPPHFMAVQGFYKGKCIVVFNIYTPHRPRDREQFYRSLGDLEIPCGALFVVGGDFNCTLDAVADRSYTSTSSSHNSPALKALLAIWRLVASVAIERPQDWTSGELRRHHHLSLPLTNGRETSSRLDRWYVGPLLARWIDRTEVVDPAVHTDHRAPLRTGWLHCPYRISQGLRHLHAFGGR